MKAVIGFLLLVTLLVSGCAAGNNQAPLSTGSTPIHTVQSTPTLALPALPTSTPRPSTPSATPSKAVEAAALRGLRLSYWYSGAGAYQQEIIDQIAVFNRTNIWGITVEGRAFLTSTQLEEAFLAPGADLPNLVTAPEEMLRTWQGQTQALVPLDGLVEDEQWGLSAQEKADFLTPFWQEAGSGARLSIPAQRNVQLLFYNAGWAEALGFQDPPTTPEQLKAQACAAMKANLVDASPENDGTGGMLLSNDALALESWRRAFGGAALPAQEGQPYVFDTPESVNAFHFLKQMLDTNCAWVARNPSPYPYFAQRQALLYAGSLVDVPPQARAMDFARSEERWSVIAFPGVGAAVALTSGSGHAILRTDAAHHLAGWLFFRHLLLPRVEARLAAAASLIPVRRLAFEELVDYAQAHPQWAQAAAWVEQYQSAPVTSSWRIARRLLQDAAWQIFSPIVKADGIAGVLLELDQMIKELTARPFTR